MARRQRVVVVEPPLQARTVLHRRVVLRQAERRQAEHRQAEHRVPALQRRVVWEPLAAHRALPQVRVLLAQVQVPLRVRVPLGRLGWVALPAQQMPKAGHPGATLNAERRFGDANVLQKTSEPPRAAKRTRQ